MTTRQSWLGLRVLARVALAGAGACVTHAESGGRVECQSDEVETAGGTCRLPCNSDLDCPRCETCQDGLCYDADSCRGGDEGAPCAQCAGHQVCVDAQCLVACSAVDPCAGGRDCASADGAGYCTTANSLELVAGDNQSAPAATDVDVEPRVRVVDRRGNPILSGYAVTFTPGPGGAVEKEITQTDRQGLAGPGFWTLSATPGLNTLRAAGSPPLPNSGGSGNTEITFGVAGTSGEADHLLRVSGDGQSASVGSKVAVAPVVRVVDQAGISVEGYLVEITPSGDGQIESAQVTSDPEGRVNGGDWSLATAAGTNTLLYTGVPELPDHAGTGGAALSLNATGEALGADHLVAVQGDGQSAVVSIQVPLDPEVRVVDRYGNSVGGQSISFSPSGTGSVASSPVDSGADGVASCGPWTLDATPGDNTLHVEGDPALPDLAATGASSLVYHATGSTSIVLALDASTHDFGETGGCPSVNLVLTNAGTEASGTITITFGGSQPTSFSLAADACSGQVLDPAGLASCAMEVRFQACATGHTAGNKSASLLAEDPSGASDRIALSGIASYTWRDSDQRHGAQSYDTTAAPTGPCSQKRQREFVFLADAPDGTQYWFSDFRDDSSCTNTFVRRYETHLDTTVQNCGGGASASTGNWGLTGCYEGAPALPFWGGWYTGQDPPYADCNPAHIYIIAEYECR